MGVLRLVVSSGLSSSIVFLFDRWLVIVLALLALLMLVMGMMVVQRLWLIVIIGVLLVLASFEVGGVHWLV